MAPREEIGDVELGLDDVAFLNDDRQNLLRRYNRRPNIFTRWMPFKLQTCIENWTRASVSQSNTFPGYLMLNLLISRVDQDYTSYICIICSDDAFLGLDR